MLTSFKQNSFIFIWLIICIMLAISCQQAKEIPVQVSEDIPNPVSDFTQKDRYKLGLRWYQQGQYQIARKMWKPLARDGDCDAQYAMGLLYFNGLSVRKNRETAILWWERAADQAQPQALNSLGVVYSNQRVPYTTLDCRKGCGKAKNLVKAYKWFGLAEEYGPHREAEFAQEAIKRISSQMNDDEIMKAKSQIEGWAPKPSECKSRELFIVN